MKSVIADNIIKGNIPTLDIQYGNVWTNIPDSLIKKAGIIYGDSLDVEISKLAQQPLEDSLVYKSRIPFVHTFGEVAEGKPLAYLNSLMNFSLALNMDDFAKKNFISSGASWSIILKKPR